jgi:serine/threonine-protein kinase
VIARCLEKDPAKRFQDVAQLAAALAPFAGVAGESLAAAVARVLHGARVSLPSVPQPGMQSTPTTLRGANGVITGAPMAARTWKLPAAIGLGFATAAIAGFVAFRGNGPGTTSSAAAPPESPDSTIAAPVPAPMPPPPPPTPAAAPIVTPPVVAPPAPKHPVHPKIKAKKPVEDPGDSRT